MSQCVLHAVCVQVEVPQGLVSGDVAYLLQAASEVLSQGSHSYALYLPVHDDGAGSQTLPRNTYTINFRTSWRGFNWGNNQEIILFKKKVYPYMYSALAWSCFLRLMLKGIHYLSSKPQLACQVVMTNLLRELDAEVSVGPVIGDTFIHDLIDNVQHIVLQTSTRVSENIEQTRLKISAWKAIFSLFALIK